MYKLIHLSNIPLFRSCENSPGANDYKHLVPPGLLVILRNFARKQELAETAALREGDG
jgi:hypothetical protein